jgi:pimeloyl-ACP methyl ester carboxylesterase
MEDNLTTAGGTLLVAEPHLTLKRARRMPEAVLNGVRLAYDIRGTGEPVLLIMGSGARAQVWHVHQTPALTAAGYQVVTFNNRGTPPSEVPPGPYTIAQLVGDTVGLLEWLDLGSCRIAGISMGATVAQELALLRPDLVRALALIATRGRNDTTRATVAVGERALARSGIELPPEYNAVVQALQLLSPHTLNDDEQAKLWLETFRLYSRGTVDVNYLQLDEAPGRLEALRAIRVPTLVVAFADDLITPPKLCREVAAAIPGCQFVELARCGHLGHLERPDAFNTALLEFFQST